LRADAIEIKHAKASREIASEVQLLLVPCGFSTLYNKLGKDFSRILLWFDLLLNSCAKNSILKY
jgi:hypothetical protein